MDTLAKLEAIETIKLLKSRYFLAMDTKDWTAFGAVFADDCVMDMSGEAGPDMDPAVMIFRGREHIVGAISTALKDVVTVHQGYTPVIELQDDASATGIWGMEDNFFFPDGSEMHGFGHYREQYRKTDGQWRIVNTSVTRLRKTFTPAV